MTGLCLVVLEGGRFTLAPVGRDVEEVDLAQLRARIGAERPGATLDVGTELVPAGELPAWVEPGPARVGFVRDDGIELYSDADDQWSTITVPQLELLARVTHPVAVEGLAVPDPRWTHDLQALLQAGLIRVHVTAPAPADEPTAGDGASGLDVVATVEPALERRSILRRVTARLRQPTPPVEPVIEEDRATASDGRIPVLSFWATHDGPHLGSAAVVAYARVFEGGHLEQVFDLRLARPAAEVLASIEAHEGPVILLSSDYLWSLEANLEVAAKAMAANPSTIVIHGGPCAPRFDGDCETFLASLPPGHLVIPGEGEVTFASVLAAIAASHEPGAAAIDLRVLDGVAGVRYWDVHTGTVVRNPDRERHPDLADFPSPLISGELAEVPEAILHEMVIPIETNRGCPYGCTFCDWGQNTMARVRKFPMSRVAAELAWLADKRVKRWFVADANFGILPRDMEIVEEIVRLHEDTGFPQWFAAAPPKNSMKRLIPMLDRLLGAGIPMKCALGLQTRDPETLKVIERSNIGTSSYDELAVHLRRRGLPLNCDLMLGLPGSTVASLKDDLQWCLEQRVRPQMNMTFVLPNAPMNAPEYKAAHGIEVDDGLIMATSTFTRADRHRMVQVASAYVICEILGFLRHVLRYLQWDHGRRALDVIEDLIELVEHQPESYPLLDWAFRNTDLFVVAPVGWGPFFDEVHRAVVDGLGVPDGPGLRTALAVNRFVLPVPGRTYPDALDLQHDFVEYFRQASEGLFATDLPSAPSGPLESFGPGQLIVADDPDDLVRTAMGRSDDARTRGDYPNDFYFLTHLELLSPLIVYLPMTSPAFIAEARALLADLDPADRALDDHDHDRVEPEPVQIRAR